MKHAAILCLLLSSACTDSAGTDVTRPELAGRYQVSARWDLSSMLADEALGDATSELAVSLAVDGLGVPGFLEDDARGAVRTLLGDRVSGPVTELAASSSELAALRDDLARATVESEWLLSGPDRRERLRQVSVETGGAAYALDFTALDPAVEVGGPLLLSGSGAHREVASYELAFRAGELIRPAARDAVAAALEPFDCAAIAEAVVGSDGEISVGVGGFDYNITADEVEDVCLAARADLAARVLYLMDFELGIELGGSIALTDGDGDGVAEHIAAEPGYSGRLLDLLAFDVTLEGAARRD